MQPILFCGNATNFLKFVFVNATLSFLLFFLLQRNLFFFFSFLAATDFFFNFSSEDFVFVRQLKPNGARGYVATNILAPEGSVEAEE